MSDQPLDFRTLWEEAVPYDRFAAEAKELRALWDGVYRKTVVPDWAAEQARARSRDARMLVINEDWCWDAANVVPVLAKLSAETGVLPIRVLSRDAYPHVMDRYLTRGTRSIPIVLVLDGEFNELGHWGPRPPALQAWASDNKDRLAKNEFYAEMRRWHVRDKGASTLREVLALLG